MKHRYFAMIQKIPELIGREWWGCDRVILFYIIKNNLDAPPKDVYHTCMYTCIIACVQSDDHLICKLQKRY